MNVKRISESDEATQQFKHSLLYPIHPRFKLVPQQRRLGDDDFCSCINLYKLHQGAANAFLPSGSTAVAHVLPVVGLSAHQICTFQP